MTDTAVRWPDEIEDVLGGDLAVMLADITPMRGVVLTPLTNFGLQDRDAGTTTVLSSLGAWRKLARIQHDPKVALAFHTRRHGYSNSGRYVLVQGVASFATTPDRGWLESIDRNWTRFMGPRDRGLPWEWWMRAYQWERIGVRVRVTRVVSWDDLDCRGVPAVHGAALPDLPPPAQRAPGKGVEPRVDVNQVVAKVSSLPDTLLGWVEQDGYPVAVPVRRARVEDDRVVLDTPPGLVPAGGRRAGLTSHWFSQAVLGQEQRVHTGWLEVDGEGTVRYAPHTRAGYRLPPSKLLYRVAVGGLARYGLRQARRSGLASTEPDPSNRSPSPAGRPSNPDGTCR